ncbi:hypothetical protein CRT60_01080 [Azospirillum palustre]|uniref:Uncharacterized protein n=1 Tax=Azospirillum palustre TaxID=2044885 RepID=A0A2B8BN24_9PROT|nr:hypothetical protein [Azospirillum palustre]PGH59255.1 hypothetical protein CRT60_01080 [Azospirillum palustre]
MAIAGARFQEEDVDREDHHMAEEPIIEVAAGAHPPGVEDLVEQYEAGVRALAAGLDVAGVPLETEEQIQQAAVALVRRARTSRRG